MKKIIAILTLALMSLTAFAQHDEQVTVEGKYRPKVNKVNKIVLQPETPQPTYNLPNTEVKPIEAKKKFTLDLEKIAPTAFAAKKDQLVVPTNNFLMAGIGTRLSPIFFYKHNSMLTKTLGLGVGVKHNSSWLNIKDCAPSGYMNNAFGINLSSSAFSGLQVDGSLNYKNDVCHFYGVNLLETPLSDDQIEELCPRQTYNTIGAHLGLNSTSTRVNELNHKAHVDYFYLFDREHNLDFGYTIGYSSNFWGSRNYPQKIAIDLGFQYDYGIGQEENVFVVDRILFRINPSFEMSDDFYRLHLGARLDGATRMSETDKFISIYPDLSGSLFVLDKKLEFYAGLKGGRKMLRFSEIVDDNPFVSPMCDPRLKIRNDKLAFEGGVRTNIMEVVDLHLGVRYRHANDDPLFKTYYQGSDPMQPTSVFNMFDLVYDETQTVSVLANARVKLRNSFTADWSFAYNNCNPEQEEYAWYRPSAESKMKLTYDLNEQIAFNASLLFQGGRYAQVYEYEDYVLTSPCAKKLENVFDMSLGADYKVNDQITAFALLDNVACQKYQLYYNYPVTGIQLFAGVKLRF